MYFEEKLDILKRHLSDQDFKDPYLSGIKILKSIEKKFIVVKDIRYDLNNLESGYTKWSENIKNKTEMKSFSTSDLPQWLKSLDPSTNFWMVVMPYPGTNSKYVYACKPNALLALLFISWKSFFLVDKKYNWLLFFELAEGKTTIYQSGKRPLPFNVD